MKVIEFFLVLFLVFAAIYNFSFYEPNQWLVSIILLLSAISIIVKKGEFAELIRKASLILTLFLAAKVIFEWLFL